MILSYFKADMNEDLELTANEQYAAYVNEHKEYVKKAYEWLRENCLEIFDRIDESEFQQQIAEHDDSKFSDEEFEPYAQKWFGDGKKTPEYEAAWEHHYKNNKHHPEYWEGKDMPNPHILEMLCDWLSFGLKANNPSEILDFYRSKAKDDPEKNLSEKTKAHIEEYLKVIEEAIN